MEWRRSAAWCRHLVLCKDSAFGAATARSARHRLAMGGDLLCSRV